MHWIVTSGAFDTNEANYQTHCSNLSDNCFVRAIGFGCASRIGTG
jgi:hypothetical protein